MPAKKKVIAVEPEVTPEVTPEVVVEEVIEVTPEVTLQDLTPPPLPHVREVKNLRFQDDAGRIFMLDTYKMNGIFILRRVG